MDNKTNWSNLNKDKKEQEEEHVTLITQIYEAQQIHKKDRDNETFKRWLKEKVDNNVTVTEVLIHLCIDIIKTVSDKGFTITNEKQLKNEIATFIYKEASIHA